MYIVHLRVCAKVETYAQSSFRKWHYPDTIETVHVNVSNNVKIKEKSFLLQGVNAL